MANYKKAFIQHEATDCHKVVEETLQAERKLVALYGELESRLGKDAVFEIDCFLGEFARAYELQGFAFALNLFKAAKEQTAKATENIEPEPPVKKKRVKKTNAIGEKGIPVRLVTACGFTKTVTEWHKILRCSLSTISTHLNRGDAHFEEWVARRLELSA